MKLGIVSAIAVESLAWASASSASLISFGGGGSTADGSVSASAVFTTDNSGNLTIVLNNLISGQNSQGQSVSGVTFTFGGTAVGALTFISEAGTRVNVATGGAETPFVGVVVPRWHLIGGPGTTAIGGGQPSEMIVGKTPAAGTGGFPNFNPYFDQTLTVVIHGTTLDALTTITAASFLFGTGPDYTKPGTECTSPTQPNCGGTPGSGTSSSGRTGSGDVPEPSSPALALLGLALLSGTLLRRKMFSGRA